MPHETADRWRIGVLASRVGVSETLLRAWELRYGLLNPGRTASGYRLYGPEDERRARAMAEARERGVPAAAAAAAVLASSRGALVGPAPHHDEPTHAGAAAAVARLRGAITDYDVDTLHAVLDDVLATRSIESAVRDVLLPFLELVGSDWAEGALDVADEHFASDVVRGRLAALAVGDVTPTAPLALLACPPGERHDIALKAFQVLLQRSGWRTRYLGADTPYASIVAASEVIAPDVVVVAGTTPEVFLDPPDALRGRRSLFLAGAGADRDAAVRWGATHLGGDPVTAVRMLNRTSR